MAAGCHIIDDERSKRLEEYAGGAAIARRLFTAFAGQTAQLIENEIASRIVLAAQHPALEFSDQLRSGLNCQPAQELAQPVDGLPAAPHSRLQVALWLARAVLRRR